MNKVVWLLLAFICYIARMEAQSLTEAERQVSVRSQIMTCKGYGTMKRYEEAYLLAKELMQGHLTDSEKKEVGHLYAMNGYMYATGFMRKDNAQYAKAREILEEVAPYADGELKDYVLLNMATAWYFEGAECLISQKYDKALACFQHALKGFHELGKTKNEISVLKQIAVAKEGLWDMVGSEDAYKQALSLAKQIDKADAQMEILRELWALEKSKGDVRQTQIYAASMDSLIERSSDVQTKYSYYNQKGNEAKKNGQYGIAEQWLLRGKDMAEEANATEASVYKHLSYLNLQKLYAAAGRYDEALLYAKKAVAEFQAYTSPNDATYNMPYMDMADIYRLKGDKDNVGQVLKSCSRMLRK